MSVYSFFNNIYNIVRRVCNETISTLSGKMSLFVVFRFNINDNCSLSIPMFFVMMSFKLPNVSFCLFGHWTYIQTKHNQELTSVENFQWKNLYIPISHK